MLDRPGTYRGLPQDWGVSESRGGFPQFTVRLKALEFYDEEAGEYVDWSQYDMTAEGYLVLYTKDAQGQWKELMHAAQLKKVFGWDGLTFESLANGKYGETTVLFRVEAEEFEGKTRLKLQWIDTADASPTKQLPKYDAAKLKVLTAKMGGALSASVAPPTPAKAPTSVKPTAPKRGPGRPPKSTPAASPAPVSAAGTPAAPSTATPPPVSPAPAPTVPSPAPTTPTPAPVTPATKDSAWAAVNEMSGVTDEKLAEIWIAEGAKIDKAESQFTPEDWATLQEAVLKQTSKF